MNVHCLASCLRPDRFGAVALLFHTVRRGFPSCKINVYGNSLSAEIAHHTQSCCRAVDAEFFNLPNNTAHGRWIEHLVQNERDPFWICDTDLVFFGPVQDWFRGRENDVLYSGRFEPTFWGGWTQTMHMERLHPSLMWFNPQLLRAAARSTPTGNQFLSTIELNLYRWQMVPERKADGSRLFKFYDTCSGLWHALDGLPFTEEMSDQYEHLYNGSYLHLMPGVDGMLKMHDDIFKHPAAAKGLWKSQQKWYLEHAVKG